MHPTFRSRRVIVSHDGAVLNVEEADEVVVAGLPKLLGAFGEAGPWVTLDFLLAPDDTLDGQTPLETLKADGWTGALDRLARMERGDGFG